jgi:ankyrin repeat protein
LEIVEFLLKAGAKKEEKDEHHCTPLHAACKKGSQECVQKLLESGANVMALDHR